ncbi:Sel1 domain protein repeat-containing protein [gut metagenome]|uniref:Sel1 domain protein repeat-containing protein n=1 Tax=gut metagenome TaxID=749906 RepID=J9GJ26_9ZZZZ
MEQPYVFISYSSANKAIADATCHILEESGISCWIAPRNIVPGNTWAGNIVQAIRNCSLMVLIYSQQSNNSSQVANEVDKAFCRGKVIIPFLVDDTPMNDDFEYYLSRKHWLVAYPDYKEMLTPLVEAVAANLHFSLDTLQQPKTKKEVTGSRLGAADGKATDVQGTQPPMYDKALENAQKALLTYDIDQAFAELIRPALDGCQEAQFTLMTILDSYQRMQKVKKFRFQYLKEQADEGHPLAQYAMARYHLTLDYDETTSCYYAILCGAQEQTYGLRALARIYEFGLDGTERRPEEAQALLDKALNQDDPFAVLRVAKDCLYGWTREQNIQRALTLLKRCMEWNIPESYQIMGKVFSEGIGLEINSKKAEEYFVKAIEKGYPEAYSSWAFHTMVDCSTWTYRNEAELQEGIRLLRKGVDLGIAECLSDLALCYEQGIGVPQKSEQAVRWYRKAALAGNADSFTQLGNLYYQGLGCQQSAAEAWKWFKQGCQTLRSGCFYGLGVMCLEGNAQEGKKMEDCISYFEEALYLSGGWDSSAALQLYQLFRTRSLECHPLLQNEEDTYVSYPWAPKDNRRALAYLRKAADKNTVDPNLCFKCGAILCSEGHGLTDEFEGIRYLKKAVKLEHPLAAVLMAHLYEEGELVDKDETKVRACYQLAADKDCGDGYEGLAKLTGQPLMGKVDEGGELPDWDEATKRSVLNQTYDYMIKADELGCKMVYPLENTLSSFMLESALLSPNQRRKIVELTTKFAHRGNPQSIVDCGVIYHMGFLTDLDLNRAIAFYRQAVCLGKDCAAKNLGDLYSGVDEEMPINQQDPATAAYWYAKDPSEASTQRHQELLKIGHREVLESEQAYPATSEVQALKWIFPLCCDPMFSPDAPPIRLFEWAHFDLSHWTDSLPGAEEPDACYLPKNINEFYKAYKNLFDLLVNRYRWNAAHLPTLSRENFFPYLPARDVYEIARMTWHAWMCLIKKGSDARLKEKLSNLTFLYQDFDRILEVVETYPDPVQQELLIALVNVGINLEALPLVYTKLFAWNDWMSHEEKQCHFPISFILDLADQFFWGSDDLPRNRALSYRLYALIPNQPGVEEKMNKCNKFALKGRAAV